MKVAISSTTKVALTAVALILIPTAPVHANASQASWQEHFNTLDQDRDGLLSRAEYEHAISQQESAKPQALTDKSAQSAIQTGSSQQAMGSQQGQTSSSQQAMSSQQGQTGGSQLAMGSQQGQIGGAQQVMGSQQGQIGVIGMQMPTGMQIPYLVLIPNPSHMNQAGYSGAQVPYTGSQVPYLHPFSMPQTAQSPTWQSQPYWAYTGGSAMQTAQGSFDALDSDRNGYLSVFEAFRHSPLLQSWNTADANRDGVIERAEFSAFEARGGR